MRLRADGTMGAHWLYGVGDGRPCKGEGLPPRAELPQKHPAPARKKPEQAALPLGAAPKNHKRKET